VNDKTRTDIFAPGAPVTSADIRNDQAESIQHGTSQAKGEGADGIGVG